MAYASANTTFAHPAGFGLSGIAAAFADWRLYRRTLAELRALSNRELADVGLSRFQLTAVAREAVYGA